MTHIFRILKSTARVALHTSIAFLIAGLSHPAGSQTTTIPRSLQEVVYRNAPFIIGEVADLYDPFSTDQIIPVDFDGNVNAADNYEHAAHRNQYPTAGDWNRSATVYFSVTENGMTSDVGYYFIGYYWYHARDAGFSVFLAGNSSGHEHDMEGVFLVVKKSPYYPYGLVVDALTEAHGALIPYLNGNQSLVNPNAVADAVGTTNFWTDGRYGSQRTVAAIRSSTHGSYMAQICPAGIDGPHGMVSDAQSPGSGVKQACLHSDNQWILYTPMLWEALAPSSGLPGPDALPFTQRSGYANYQLIELTQSVLWANREVNQALFTDPLLYLSGGMRGYGNFYSTRDPNQANPPWWWEGGAGENVAGCYWYSFGIDATSSCNSHRAFPQDTWAGILVAAPRSAIGSRFPYLAEMSEPMRYNPYLDMPPEYNGPPQLKVAIIGPDNIGNGQPATWQLSIDGGVAPFTYQWSGAVSGSGTSASATLYSDDWVYLDVWDSAGQHSAVSLYITVSGCPNGVDEC